MLKNILELEGVQELNKKQQKLVNGGGERCGDPVPGIWDPEANGGQGGQMWHQTCKKCFLGICGSSYVVTFSTSIPYA